MQRRYFFLLLFVLSLSLLLLVTTVILEITKAEGEKGDQGPPGEDGPPGPDGERGLTGDVLPSISVSPNPSAVLSPSFCNNFVGIQINLVESNTLDLPNCIPEKYIYLYTFCPGIAGNRAQQAFYRDCSTLRVADGGEWDEWRVIRR